jgi:hypothetical protein
LPELHEGGTICGNAHVANTLGMYDLIVRRELPMNLGIILNFSTQLIEWNEMEIPMKPENATPEQAFYIKDSQAVSEAGLSICHVILLGQV